MIVCSVLMEDRAYSSLSLDPSFKLGSPAWHHVPESSWYELQAEVESAAYWFAQSTCLEMGTSINTSQGTPPPHRLI